MSARGKPSGTRALPALLAVSLFLLAFAGLFLASQPAAATIVVVNGDWTVVGGTSEVYDGITFKVDGDVTVETGALLEIRNGGLIFLNDVSDDHALTIQDGGSGHGILRLANSSLTTEPVQINVSLDLDVTVAGTLELLDGSIQKHPGTLTTSGDAAIEVRDSTVTGFTDAEISGVTSLPDSFNDAPRMTFADSSTVLIANSTVERLYENFTAPRPNPDYDIAVGGSAILTIIDSSVGVDFTPGNTTRNTIVASDTSRVYIYNMTVDEDQSAPVPVSSWESALLANGASAEIYIHRWLDARVTDRFGNGVPGAYVEARTMPVGALAVYPRNGGANTPSSDLLDYVGVTAGTFNVTGSSGGIRIPLLTEWITSSTLPNSEFDGSYRIRGSFGGEEAITYVTFDAYPVVTALNNSRSVTVTLDGLVHPAQDTTYVWDSPTVIDYDVTLDGNLQVTGDVTLVGSSLSILQGDAASGRHYVTVEGEGSLTLVDAGLGSNLPLVVYLRDNGQLNAVGTQLILHSEEGRGVIYSEGSSEVDLRDGFLEGDLMALGAGAGLRNVTLSNSELVFNNSGISYLWTPTFEEEVSLAFLSDDGDVGTVDFDVRNVSFAPEMADDVVFSGNQYAMLTNVTFATEEDWWVGRISDGAKVAMYWWLTIEAIDGVGDPVTDVNFTLRRLNPQTLAFAPVPAPSADDLYYATYDAGTFVAPAGRALYRAQAQERFAATGWSNSTYRVNASVEVDGISYYAESEPTATVMSNMVLMPVLFNWPDLRVDAGFVIFNRAPVQGALVGVNVTVFNDGKANAFGAVIELREEGVLMDAAETDVPLGGFASVSLTWVPEFPGTRTLTVTALSRNDTASNRDLNFRNNRVDLEVEVLTKPDLEVRAADYNATNAVQGQPFSVTAVVYNLGTTSTGAEVGLYLDSVAEANLLVLAELPSVPAGGNTSFEMEVNQSIAEGNYTLILIADPFDFLPEVNENNNRVDIPLEVVPPEGQVFIDTPTSGAAFELGGTIFASGTVTTPTGRPIAGLSLTVGLRDPEGVFYSPQNIQTDANGVFAVGVPIPEDAPSGAWTLTVTSGVGSIQGVSLPIGVSEAVPWYNIVVPLINAPLWMVLAGVVSVVLLLFALAGYMKTVGLGRLVECGECGAFISEGASSCPKCGTEFEKEMAKCSSCHAWIPLDVKQCPECGVTFTSGKVRGKDRQEIMRRQYANVVSKYRAEAARSLGRTPSEKEFQEWWRRQPTFVTFDQWRKEEEEMRKMGSKACPQCGALNSVTAKVCHSCGKLQGGKGGVGGSIGRPPVSPPPGGAPGGPSSGQGNPVLKKILKKPFKKRKQAK